MSFSRIKQKYVATFSQKLDELQESWAQKNISEIHQQLHKLTGSSGGYGFSTLCLYCQQGTKLTRNLDTVDLTILDECLQKIFTILIDEGDLEAV